MQCTFTLITTHCLLIPDKQNVWDWWSIYKDCLCNIKTNLKWDCVLVASQTKKIALVAMCFILKSIHMYTFVIVCLFVYIFFFLSKGSHYSLSSVSEDTRVQLQWLWSVWSRDHPGHYPHVCGPQACAELSDEVQGTCSVLTQTFNASHRIRDK